MPVFSYLAYPEKGAKEQLRRDLAGLDHCEVMASENEEVLVLVTDTPDEEMEKTLKKKLEGLKSLQSLGMTFGYADAYRPDEYKPDEYKPDEYNPNEYKTEE